MKESAPSLRQAQRQSRSAFIDETILTKTESVAFVPVETPQLPTKKAQLPQGTGENSGLFLKLLYLHVVRTCAIIADLSVP